MGVFKEMKELELKYGCNPNQRPARIFMREGELPITVLSPAGAALGLPLDDTLKKMYFVEDIELSPLACAYACARGADRMSSFGDWIALSDECDEATAKVIQHEVSDGVIAPGYSAAALAILKTKRKGGYNIVAIDPSYQPAPVEHKDVFGITFEQGRNELKFGDDTFSNIVTRNRALTDEQKRDLTLCLIALKYTQSNSVCYAQGGQLIGVGAGQQSRIHCTRLAGNKADIWQLRHHPKVLGLPFRPDVSRPKRMAVQGHGRLSRQRRIFPLWGQHRARAPFRRDGHRGAGRLHPGRAGH